MIDATIVARARCSWREGGTRNQAVGRWRGGLSTEVRRAVDALGSSDAVILTAGQVHGHSGQHPHRGLTDLAPDAPLAERDSIS